jgi:peptidoglycan hydrolase CwlO-like protein
MELNLATIVTVIGLFFTITGGLIGILVYKRLIVKDIQKDTKEGAILSTKLDFITTGVTNIQIKMETQDAKFNSLGERVTRTEESCKQAHKRLDEIEEKERK